MKLDKLIDKGYIYIYEKQRSYIKYGARFDYYSTWYKKAELHIIELNIKFLLKF